MKAADFYALAKQNGLSREDADSAAADYVKESGGFEDMKPESQGTKAGQNPDTTRTEPGQPLAGNGGIGADLKDIASRAGTAISKDPLAQAAVGGLHEARQTFQDPIMQIASKFGLPFAQKILEQSKEEDKGDTTTAAKLGKAGTDIGIGISGMGKGIQAAESVPFFASKYPIVAKAFGMTVPGVAAHQAQTFGQTGQVDPKAAAEETALGTAVGTGGMAAGKKMLTAAPGLLRWILNVGRKDMDGANAPDAKSWLENKLIPFFGGAKAINPEVAQGLPNASIPGSLQSKIAELDKSRSGLLDAAKVNLNHPDVMRKVGTRQAGLEASSKANSGEGVLMNPAADQAVKNAREVASMTDEDGTPILVPGSKSVGLRKLADLNSKYDRISNPLPPPGVKFNRMYRKEVEDQLAGKMRDLAQPDQTAAYNDARKQLRLKVPLEEVTADYLNSPHAPGLLRYGRYGARAGGAGIGAAVGAAEDPEDRSQGAMIGGLTGLGGEQLIERLLTTPGGSRMIYETGKNLSKKSIPRRVLMGAVRNGFSPDLGDQ